MSTEDHLFTKVAAGMQVNHSRKPLWAVDEFRACVHLFYWIA